MNEHRKQIVSGVFFIVFALVFYLESYNLHVSRADALGPQFFPRLISICMLIFALGIVVRGYIGLKREHVHDTKNMARLKKKLPNIPLFLSAALFMVYFFLIDLGGYIIMTAIYIFFQTLLLLPPNLRTAKKHITITVIIAVALPVGLYHLFSQVLMYFSPQG